MAGGGKGGSQTTKVQIPQWLEDPSKRAIQRGEAISQIGYTPYMGPDLAAFTPMQEAAFSNTNAAAEAFGLSGGGMGVPQAQDFGGFGGYSAHPIYEQSQAAFGARYPGQADYMSQFSIDPQTGLLGRFQ